MPDLTIQGLVFDAPAPYAEGHVLAAIEAATLNQTLAENLRNNFAKTVTAAKAEAVKSRGEGAALTDDEVAQLQLDFQTYAGEYKFAGRSAPRTPVDPVKREASKIAREAISGALKAQNIKVSELADGQMDDLIEELLESNPEIMEEAKARVAKAKQMAAGLNLANVQRKPETQAAAAE